MQPISLIDPSSIAQVFVLPRFQLIPNLDSERATFLFLSRDLFEKGSHKARHHLDKDFRMYENAKNGNLRKSDYVRIFKVLWASVDVTLTLQEHLIPFTPMDRDEVVRKRMGAKCEFFKLKSIRDMIPEKALRLCCQRTRIKHLIPSLKRISGIKPIRVWSTDSVDGSMVLALLSEAAIAMALYCMDGEGITVTDEDGNEYEHTTKPSTESIVNALTHLTPTRFRNGHEPYRTVTSN